MNINQLKIIFPLAAAFLFQAPQAQGALYNLLTNGSFETPDTPAGTDPRPPEGFIGYGVGSTALTGWSISGNTVYVLDNFDNFDTYAFDSVASDGDQFVQLANNASDSTISQTIDTRIGKTYTLSFDYGGVNAATQTRTLTYNYGAGDQFLTYEVSNLSLGVNEWWSHSVNFVASSTTTTISFTGDYWAGFWGVGVDNVVVTPEPSSTALLGLGGLALALRRRRA